VIFCVFCGHTPFMTSDIPHSTSHTPQSPARVLIVDDHAIVRYGMGVMLAGADDLILCGEAENIDDGLKAVRELNPDVAVIDLVLKNENGLDLIRKIRSQESASFAKGYGGPREDRSQESEIRDQRTEVRQSPSTLNLQPPTSNISHSTTPTLHHSRTSPPPANSRHVHARRIHPCGKSAARRGSGLYYERRCRRSAHRGPTQRPCGETPHQR
jgi:CheY-like chemotaxis protein